MAAHAYPIGQPVLIRTVTFTYTGRLDSVTAGELVITDAAWIAETARFSVSLATGELNEVEPYPDGHKVVISRGAIVDCCPWAHPLPRRMK